MPPNFPQEYRRLVTLRDGRSLLIRPVLPSDAPALADAIKSADTYTLRRRFVGRHLRVTPALLNFLTTVDYTSRFALFAVEPAGQRVVAIARYEPAEQQGVAEVAIAVLAAWRGVGLASHLLRMLAQAASERGFDTFTGMYLADNNPVAALVNEAHELSKPATADGIIEFSVPVRSAYHIGPSAVRTPAGSETDHAFAEPEGHRRTRGDTKARHIEAKRTQKETPGH